MTEVIGIRFKKVGKTYYFSPGEEKLEIGDYVVVETSRGMEIGEVVIPNTMMEGHKIISPLKNMSRRATPSDIKKMTENRKREEDAFALCEGKIASHNLDMKLIDVEYAFDNSKILFYFTADGRIDFRDLVKDLASVFKTRIELRQIGVRDESKMLGGLGICGRELCCSSFLGEFQPVSIKMAKEQGLSLNPVKISGTCGRLMCCLKYEQDAYEDLIKKSPRLGATVKTKDGVGTVCEIALIKGEVKVRIEGVEGAPPPYKISEIEVIRDGKPQQHRDESKK